MAGTPALELPDGRHVVFDGSVTHVMGVVNLSPESRVRHSVVATPAEALGRARRCRELGAALIDLGAQSSHFENRELTPEEELDRLLPALRLLVDDGFAVSVDTWKPEVAHAALEAGAVMVNDTGGLQDPAMARLVAERGVWAVAMYIEGANPLRVGDLTFTDDRITSVVERVRARLDDLAERGITKVLVDPGLSINYRSDYEEYGRHQIRVIRGLDALRALGHPVLVPVPRKAELHRMAAYLVLAIEHRADVVRVHDVEIACDLVRLLGRAGEP